MSQVMDRPGSDHDVAIEYEYDSNDRLLSEARYAGLSPTGEAKEIIQYGWNATQQFKQTSTTNLGTVRQIMRYGLMGQLESAITERLDATGTVQSRNQIEYRYGPQGLRYLSVESNDSQLATSSFDRSEIGHVAYVIEASSLTGFGQSILETEFDASGVAIRRTSYTFGKDLITETVTDFDSNTGASIESTTWSFGHDGKGTARVLYDASSVLSQIFTYTAYGELLAIHNGSGVLQAPGTHLTSMLYNGERFDSVIGRYNMRARWYAPESGRFDRLDPFQGNPHDPASYHKYAFVHGDPIQGTDPTGLYTGLTGLMGAFAAMGALTGAVTGGVIATYSGGNIYVGILGGAMAGALIGAGAIYGGAAMVSYFGAIYSVILSALGSEIATVLFLEAWQMQTRRQRGPSPSPAQARHDYDYALLALGVYDQDFNLDQQIKSAGWASDRDLDNFANRGYSYHARIYTNHRRREVVMAFEGTASLADWANNVEQGTGFDFEGYQYQRAKQDANIAIARAQSQNYSVRFVGHSLGGGLATAAALYHVKPATVFNAAGINTATTCPCQANSVLTNYRVRGEILSTLQDMMFFGWLLPDSIPGSTYWLEGRSGDPIRRHSDDILPGMRDWF
jgi:RHS repeat-associated protein